MNPITYILLLVICFPIMGLSHICKGGATPALKQEVDLTIINNAWFTPRNLKVQRIGASKSITGFRDINGGGYRIT